MALSNRSILDLADSLREDFSVYLNTSAVYEQRFSELLADAVTDFIEEELGDIDEQLALDLAVELVSDINI